MIPDTFLFRPASSETHAPWAVGMQDTAPHLCCTHGNRDAFLPRTGSTGPPPNNCVNERMPALGVGSPLVQYRDRVFGITRGMQVPGRPLLAGQLHPMTLKRASTKRYGSSAVGRHAADTDDRHELRHLATALPRLRLARRWSPQPHRKSRGALRPTAAPGTPRRDSRSCWYPLSRSRGARPTATAGSQTPRPLNTRSGPKKGPDSGPIVRIQDGLPLGVALLFGPGPGHDLPTGIGLGVPVWHPESGGCG